MKNLLVLAVLSLFGFASCEQIETVEPSTKLNEELIYTIDQSILDVENGLPTCASCEVNYEKEIVAK